MGSLCSKRNPEETGTKPKRFNIDEESKRVSNLNSTNIRPYKIKPPPRNSTSINKPDDHKPVYFSLTEVRKKYSHLFLPPIQNSTDYQDMIATDIEKSQDSVIDYSAHFKSSPQVGQSSACNLSVQDQQDLADKCQYEDILNAPIITISRRLPINSLKAVYFFNKEFKKRVENLKPLYQSWVRVRGDGNCYYRAVGVAFMELCCRPSTSPDFIVCYANTIKLTTKYQVTGVEWEVYNYHYSELNILCLKKQYNEPDLMIYLQNLIQNLIFDQGMVAEMRKLAAFVLNINRTNPDFTAFMVDPLEFHMKCILTWGQEAEGIEFNCMSEALGVKILHVSVFDSDVINTFAPSNGSQEQIHILYKTGHYDLLYTEEHNRADEYEVSSECFVINACKS